MKRTPPGVTKAMIEAGEALLDRALLDADLPPYWSVLSAVRDIYIAMAAAKHSRKSRVPPAGTALVDVVPAAPNSGDLVFLISAFKGSSDMVEATQNKGLRESFDLRDRALELALKAPYPSGSASSQEIVKCAIAFENYLKGSQAL